jgi:DNA-directed RNA polymerase subunit RPC12/RpoP
MRLIDADAYMEKVRHEAKAMPRNEGATFVTLSEWIMEKTPSVKPKQGEWNPYYTEREHNNIFNCELCGDTFFVMQGKDDMNFCPNCGSRNRKE